MAASRGPPSEKGSDAVSDQPSAEPIARRLHVRSARVSVGDEAAHSEGNAMVVRVATVAFEGIEARPVDVQVQIANGSVVFNVVGLGDKAVAESRERVRSALTASGLALPAKRITVNLAPADLPRKAGNRTSFPLCKRGVVGWPR